MKKVKISLRLVSLVLVLFAFYWWSDNWDSRALGCLLFSVVLDRLEGVL